MEPVDLHVWPVCLLGSASSYLCLRQLTYNDATWLVLNGAGKEQEYPKVPQSVGERRQLPSDGGCSLVWPQDNSKKEGAKEATQLCLSFFCPFFFSPPSWKLSPLL